MINRREFLKQGSLLGVATALAPSLLKANDGSSFNDYKALVVVYLDGGNDGINTFIPIGSGNDEYGYNAYLKARETIAVKNNDLSDKLKNSVNDDGYLNLSAQNNLYYEQDDALANYQTGFYAHDKGYNANGDTLNLNFNNQIGTHAFMPEIANMVNQGKVAIIQNVGNLIEPTTRDDILNNRANLPPFLMAHDHQSNMTFNGNAHQISDFGLFGKLYDYWSKINGNSIYKMNQSLYSTCHMMYGVNTQPLILGSDGIAYFDAPDYDYREYYHLIDNYKRDDIFRDYYNKLHKHSFTVSNSVNKQWRQYDSIFNGLTDSYGNNINQKTRDEDVAIPHGNVGMWDSTFLSAAKLIKIGYEEQIKRQVIYIRLASFDTHGLQRKTHGIYLRAISAAIGKFQKIIEANNLSDKVTLFNISDFGRSVGANGDGTDHAWGNHLFVIGGAVKGGLYGNRPSLKLGGIDDMSQKGRLIPTISMAQYYNTILEWFGADEEIRKVILPDLKNFDKSSWNLNFFV